MNITKHLHRLKKIGFVDYESVNVEEPGFVVYRWVKGRPQDAKLVKKYPTLTRRVADLIYKQQEISTHEAAKIWGLVVFMI